MKKIRFKFNIEKFLVFSFLISFSVCLYLSYAAKDNNKLLVKTALLKKTYYDYSIAYDSVIKLPEGKEKNSLLKDLNSISKEVLTPEVAAMNNLLQEMVTTKSGKTYDFIMKKIAESGLKQPDKSFFYSEVFRLGAIYVWTPDYSQAVKIMSETWIDITEDNIKKAEESIEKVQLQVNKDYLQEELAKIKKKYNEKNQGTY